jgi:uncharacterized protein
VSAAELSTDDGLRRRRAVCAVAMLVGAGVLAVSLRIEPGDPLFYPATVALAAVWVIAAIASGPLHLGRVLRGDRRRRPVIVPVLLGLGLAAVFLGGGLLVRRLPFLGDQVRSVTDFAEEGALVVIVLVTLVNGIAEEMFFRGAVYEAAPRYPIAVATVANALVVAASGNLMLTFAAVLLGLVVGLQRRATGGLLAPVLTHITWSTVMLIALPLLFG